MYMRKVVESHHSDPDFQIQKALKVLITLELVKSDLNDREPLIYLI